MIYNYNYFLNNYNTIIRFVFEITTEKYKILGGHHLIYLILYFMLLLRRCLLSLYNNTIIISKTHI